MSRVPTPILNILSAATVDGNALQLNGKLDRKDYEAVAKVIEAAGGKWNRKAGRHLFEEPAEDAIDQIILTGEVVAKKQELQQFFTPPDLAARMVELADVRAEHRTLEPSAGKGAIAIALKSTGASVHCIEIDRTLYQGLVERRYQSDLGDFLELSPDPLFDRIVMNPPFARQADIRHVQHAAKFLKAGGKLVSIMSASVAFRDNRFSNEFRDFVQARQGTIEALPEGSFKASGTAVSTALVTLHAEAS